MADVAEWDAEDFLELVYGEKEGWIDLPAKVNGYWVPFHTEWPADGAVSRRIDSSLRDGEDLYYSVAQFARRGRRIEDVLPTNWLWADLDEVHPATADKLGLLPTVAVESSPGRYQALWRITNTIKPKTLEKLNRALSYALEADKGGWDLTQVLRIPGTRNFKYQDAPIVRLLWYNEDLSYDPKEVWGRVKRLVPEQELRRVVSVQIPRRPIPSRAKVLLRTPVDQVVEGERSARLWELECLLAESGLSEDEIFSLCWDCAWNKWRGIGSGRSRLKRDVRKAVTHVSRKSALKSASRDTSEVVENEQAPDEGEAVQADTSEGSADRLPWVGYSSFLAMRIPAAKWMVENIWTASSHGIAGGEPKTSKTTFCLALGMAVASGTPFLNEYPVHAPGPVLYVNEETAPWVMQDRMRKIAAYYHLLRRDEVHVRRAEEGALGKVSVEVDFPRDYPFELLNNYGFDLTIEEHRDLLVSKVEEIEPALLVLDPLGWMIGDADENRAVDMRPILKWLMRLRYEANMAIVVVHHFGKATKDNAGRRSGQRVLGSAMFHGWVDSALYFHKIESEREGWTRSKIETEFRSMAERRPFEVDWNMGDVGSLEMHAEIRTRSLAQSVIDMVIDAPGITVNQIAESLEKDRRTILAVVRGSEDKLRIEGGKKGRGQSHRVFLTADDDVTTSSGGEDD